MIAYGEIFCNFCLLCSILLYRYLKFASIFPRNLMNKNTINNKETFFRIARRLLLGWTRIGWDGLLSRLSLGWNSFAVTWRDVAFWCVRAISLLGGNVHKEFLLGDVSGSGRFYLLNSVLHRNEEIIRALGKII